MQHSLNFQDYGRFDDIEINSSILRAFQDIRLNNTHYMLSITGAVGSGKSTLLEALSHCLHATPTHSYPEFVKKPEGHIMFEKYVNGLISALTFQSYILDTYNEIQPNIGINLIERCPDDTVLIFCKEHLNNNRMSIFEYNCLQTRLEELLIEKPFIPTRHTEIRTIDIAFDTTIDDELMKCYDIIKSDVENNVHSRVIFLKVPSHILAQRIANRNRSEESAYTLGYIESINMMYNEMYA